MNQHTPDGPDHSIMPHRQHGSLPADRHLADHSIYHLDAVWTDHRNERFSLSKFEGRPVILTMLYSRCVGTCPVLIQDARRIYESLPENLRAETALIAVTFDHEHDTPEVLAEYAAYRRYDRPNWHFLHGDRSRIRELATVLGIRYSFREDGMIAHTDRIVILDRNGRIVETLDGILQPSGHIITALVEAVR